jgi:hypothetical protein
MTECTFTQDWTLQQHDGYDLTLLMGLDLPQLANGGGASPAEVDMRLRRALDSDSIVYAVVYGTGQARIDCALQAIAYHRKPSSMRTRPTASTWQWCCDTCSDAACEHRLFTALVSSNQPSVRP